MSTTGGVSTTGRDGDPSRNDRSHNDRSHNDQYAHENHNDNDGDNAHDDDRYDNDRYGTIEAEEYGHVVWSGSWVTERLGVELTGGDEVRELLGMALRRNPRRAHLLVSNVLGKHVPQRPSVVHGAGVTLGARVRDLLGDAVGQAVIVGYAETATGLGHSVADGVAGAPYLHSTRRPVPGVPTAGGFEESHSHATSHLLLPEDPELLAGDGPLVLVDDEFSTGNTVLNTIRALHARRPRRWYVIVALVDMRSPADRGRLAEFAREIGARVDLVATASGTVGLPGDVLARGQALVAEYEARAVPSPPPPYARDTGGDGVVRVPLGWPAGLPDGGRHGFTPAHRARLEAAAPGMAAVLAEHLGDARRVLVLGFEELMYAPLRLALELERTLTGAEVRYSTTTRSPVLAVDDPGYAIRSRLVFPAHDTAAFPAVEGAEGGGGDGAGDRYAYNVAGGGFDAVVLIVDSPADSPELRAPGGLLAQLADRVPRVLLGVVPSYVPAPVPAPGSLSAHAPDRQEPAMLPPPLRGPAFSSYAADDVGWLLQDLSDVELEAPTEEREEAIQSGGAHYAESLPVEYQPSAAYQDLFRSALATSAARIARAVGSVTETVLAEHPHRYPDPASREAAEARPVLVSLARAGTPSASSCAAGPATGTTWTCRTTPCPSCAAGASTPTPSAGSPPTTARPTSSSSTDGPARAPSPANWPTRCATSPTSTPRSPSSPTPAAASVPTAPVRTSSSPPPASTRRSPASSRARCCAPTSSALTTSTGPSTTANSPAPMCPATSWTPSPPGSTRSGTRWTAR